MFLSTGVHMRTATLLLALIVTPAGGQEAIPLKWSLKEGDKFFVKDDTEMITSATVMGMKQDSKITAITIQRFKVIAAKQDSTTVELTTLSLEIITDGAVNIPGLGTISERIKGSTVTAVLDENMTVTKLQGYDKFIDKLADNDDDLRKQMKQQFSETSVSEMFSQVFSFCPKKPVNVGDTWPRTEKMSLGGIDAVNKMKFKLDSITGGVAKMGYTGDLTVKAGATIPGLPEGIQVDKFDIKVDKLGGMMTFDTKAERLTESTQNGDINATMTLAAGGQKIEMAMKIKLKQKVTIDNKNPIKD
jgi:hypothetical protein